MIMTRLEWILARVRNYCETPCIARVLHLFWEPAKSRVRECVL